MENPGFTIWITGLSGSGKTTIALALQEHLRSLGRRVEVLDGDTVRSVLSPDLGFSRPDRDANVRRVAWVCELLSRNGIIAIAALISPYRDVRDEARRRIGRFVEVHMDAPLETLQQRDVKGLYRRASRGELGQFTGLDDPYEPPLDPDVLVISDGREAPSTSVKRIIAAAARLGYIENPRVRDAGS